MNVGTVRHIYSFDAREDKVGHEVDDITFESIPHQIDSATYTATHHTVGYVINLAPYKLLKAA